MHFQQLTKNPADYPDSKAQPHAAVALRLNNTGDYRFKHGDTVAYLICDVSDLFCHLCASISLSSISGWDDKPGDTAGVSRSRAETKHGAENWFVYCFGIGNWNGFVLNLHLRLRTGDY